MSKDDPKSNLAIQIKLKKLKLAKKLAITKSKKQKILREAGNLADSTDERIKSIALNKFVIRKAARLKTLGKTREEINSLIIDIEASSDTILDRSSNSLKGIGIDKKFIGLSADQILQKVNAIRKPSEEADTPSKVNDKIDVPDPLTISSNPDVDTTEATERNNDKIYEHLINSGEVDIANYILDLMTKPKNESSVKDVSQIKQNTEELKRLSAINSEIYTKLEELDDTNKQDTSIDIPTRLEQEKENETIIQTQNVSDEKKGGSFISTLLELLLGKSIFNLLTKSGTLLKLGITLLSASWGWLKGRLLDVIKASITLALKPINYAISKLNDIVSIIKKTLASLASQISALKNMIPGLKKDTVKPKPTVASDKDTKKKPTPISENNKEVKRVQNRGNRQQKKPKVRAETPRAETPRADKVRADKVRAETPRADKVTTDKVRADKLSSSQKKSPTLLKKLLRFSKAIPFIGTAITAGTAVYSAQDGYRNAHEILGVEKSELTETAKLAAAAAAVINDVSFGMISAKSTANTVLNWVEKEETDFFINKYDDQLGIINHRYFGKSRVIDWQKLSELPASDIRNIINIDDWSKDDKIKMEEIYRQASAIDNFGDVPDKEFKDFDLSTYRPSDSRVYDEMDELRDQIKFLKDEQSRAKNDKSEQKLRNLNRSISEKEARLEELETSINNKIKVVEDSPLTKDKKLQVTDTAFQNLVNSTRSYDFKTKVNETRMSPSINTINNTQSSVKRDTFEIFDNL